MIVTLALLSCLLSGLFLAIGTGLRNWRKIGRQAALQQVRSIVAERICADLRAATLLPSAGSDEAVFMNGPDQISYKLVDGKIKRNSAYLTSEGEIGRLSFAYPGGNLVEVRLDGLSFEVCARGQ